MMQGDNELNVPVPPVPPIGGVETIQNVLCDNEAASVLTDMGKAGKGRMITPPKLCNEKKDQAMGSILEDAKVGDWTSFRKAILNASGNNTLTSQDFNELHPDRTFGVIHQIAYHANRGALELLLEEFPEVDLELKTRGGRTALDLALDPNEGVKPDNSFVDYLKEGIVSQRRNKAGSSKAKDGDGSGKEEAGVNPSRPPNHKTNQKELSDMPADPERPLVRPILRQRDVSVSDISLFSGGLDLSIGSDPAFLRNRWQALLEGRVTDSSAELFYQSSTSIGQLPDFARHMYELPTNPINLGAGNSGRGKKLECLQGGATSPAAASEEVAIIPPATINVEQKLPPSKLHRRLTHTSRLHGPRSLEIWEGDVTEPPEQVDLLVVSSRNGGHNTYCYDSVVECLKKHRDVDVSQIYEERRALDFSTEKKVWISEPLEESLRFRQLLCVTIVEDKEEEDHPEVIYPLDETINRVFEAIALMDDEGVDCSRKAEGPRSIAIPLIGHTFAEDPRSGCCGEEDLARHLVSAAKKALETSPSCRKIMLYGYKKKQAELLEKAVMDSIVLWGDDTPTKDQPEIQPNTSLGIGKDTAMPKIPPTESVQRSEAESDCASVGDNDVVLGETWGPNEISSFYKQKVRRKVKVKDRDGICKELRNSFGVKGKIRFWKSKEKAEGCIACQLVGKGEHLCKFERKNGECVTLVPACDDCIKKDSSNRNQDDRKPKKPKIAAFAAARHGIVSDNHCSTDHSDSDSHEGDSSDGEESSKRQQHKAKHRRPASRKKESSRSRKGSKRKTRSQRESDEEDEDDDDASNASDDTMAEYEMFKKFMEFKQNKANKKTTGKPKKKKKKTRR